MDILKLKQVFLGLNHGVDYWNIRQISQREEYLSCRQGVLEPPRFITDHGAMITVFHEGGLGYGATADLTKEGLGKALVEAKKWAKISSKHSIHAFGSEDLPANKGSYQSSIVQSWFEVSLKEKIERLIHLASRLKSTDKIVDWSAGFWATKTQMNLISSSGAEIQQTLESNNPSMSVTAFHKGDTEFRTYAGGALCRQAGYDLLDQLDLAAEAEKISTEVIELLSAPNCPTGLYDVLLEPDQMILQIHESIGHPIELDRVLGDERNYAGTSFVTPSMFGSYRYGSDLLNITFDPSIPSQYASYGFDDEGTLAEKTFLIKDGILLKGLGGSISQNRSEVEGVANSRAVGWQRPAIDRMANLNLEPGKTSFADMVANIDKGVLMKTNRSWSIDDSRNKFQFGCELGYEIKAGKIKNMVKKPGYRGISANFWQNLSQVGNQETSVTLGTPYCGKGEPNQAINVGHASPSCVFENVQVFGGA